jgi:hypothetical protein
VALTKEERSCIPKRDAGSIQLVPARAGGVHEKLVLRPWVRVGVREVITHKVG